MTEFSSSQFNYHVLAKTFSARASAIGEIGPTLQMRSAKTGAVVEFKAEQPIRTQDAEAAIMFFRYVPTKAASKLPGVAGTEVFILNDKGNNHAT